MIHPKGSPHPSAQPGEQAFIVQSPQGVELLHGHDHCLHGGRVHEVEGQQVVDPHGLSTNRGTFDQGLGIQQPQLELWPQLGGQD